MTCSHPPASLAGLGVILLLRRPNILACSSPAALQPSLHLSLPNQSVMQATCAANTRAFAAGKACAAKPARRAAVVVRAGDLPVLPKAKAGEMVDSMGYKLMRPGVKVRARGRA